MNKEWKNNVLEFRKPEASIEKWITAIEKLQWKIQERIWKETQKACEVSELFIWNRSREIWIKTLYDAERDWSGNPTEISEQNKNNPDIFERQWLYSKIKLKYEFNDLRIIVEDFFDENYWEELDYYSSELEIYNKIIDYIAQLLFDIATENKNWRKIISSHNNNVLKLERWKLKAEVWIYRYLFNEGEITDLFIKEIEACYFEWYKKESNETWKIMHENFKYFLGFILNLSKNLRMFDYIINDDEDE
ncbi:MAG: hypothetical protein ACD_4C00030G0004 [uncultured bacterium (gcode 4)]|uniref:Uncharacterized protein n=1 Tax=uncultured bacterium (gcode 4) TaxID=1234023 RepID=K2GAK5_9BACT|nr:MAG: hypothetical protein ACD_4C00030G0004 [uncultured bacterium (gcode 4)]